MILTYDALFGTLWAHATLNHHLYDSYVTMQTQWTGTPFTPSVIDTLP